MGKLDAWREAAHAEFARLQSLTPTQIAAEVMSRAFAPTVAPGDRPHLNPRMVPSEASIANMLCPDPPAMPKGDDMKLLEQFGDFAGDSLQTLEHASLIQRKQLSSEEGTYWAATRNGLAALEAGDVETILDK